MPDDAAQAALRSLSHDAARETLIRQAFRLEGLTVGWMVIEAAVAIGVGITACSLSLLAFGADSVIELTLAGVLIWRLSLELKQGRAFAEATERRASRVAGGLLFLLAAYVIAAAAWGVGLVARRRRDVFLAWSHHHHVGDADHVWPRAA